MKTLSSHSALPLPSLSKLEHPPTATSIRLSRTNSIRRVLLHLLADLDIRIHELGHTPVETHALRLVELGIAVVGRDALLLAREH